MYVDQPNKYFKFYILGFTSMNKNFHNVSLGQGQEVVAEEAMSIAANSEFKLLQSNSVNTNSIIANYWL
jgi:hypothetical protein